MIGRRGRTGDAPAPLLTDITHLALPALHQHAARYASALGAVDLTPYEHRVFSQNGEDGVLAEILRRTGTRSRSFVEFGIGTGHQGNCLLLADVYGWTGLFLEPDEAAFPVLAAKYGPNPRVTVAQAAVTPDNVEALFAAHGVDDDLDVLSIDIDGMDYWVWKAITGYRPRVVVIEYNASLDPARNLVWPPDAGAWDGTSFYGSSIGALRRLATEKGYGLVHTDLCGVNAFFVRDDLLPAVGVDDPPVRSLNIGLVGATLPPDPQGRRWLDLDVPPTTSG